MTNYQFGQHHNKPIEPWSSKVVKQKLEYVHNNPAESSFVANRIKWMYSSARNFQDDHTLIKTDDMGFMD